VSWDSDGRPSPTLASGCFSSLEVDYALQPSDPAFSPRPLQSNSIGPLTVSQYGTIVLHVLCFYSFRLQKSKKLPNNYSAATSVFRDGKLRCRIRNTMASMDLLGLEVIVNRIRLVISN